MIPLDGPEPRSLFCAALARHVRERPHALAVRSEPDGLDVTFSQLAERIGTRAERLREEGMAPGTVAALASGNGLPFIEAFFALRLLGAPVLCLDGGLAPEALRSICRAMGATRLITRDAPPARLEAAPSPPPGTDIIKMTSGSTLDPRGACFTEAALMEGVDHIRRGMNLTPDDRVLISIPLSHSYGFDNGVLSLAVIGTPLILQPDVLPGALLATIRNRGVTFFPAVPALIRGLGGTEWNGPTNLRSVICASAPLSREAADAFVRSSGLRVRQFLGSTETGGISFETRPEDPEAEGCVGFPLPGVRIELTGEGLIRVHSPANRFALLPAGSPPPSYVETGDRAEMTPEGRLRLMGRTAHVANIGGFKIDLAAIDGYLRTLAGVDDAASFTLDDPVRGQRIVTHVESRTCTAPDLLERCRERLSAREVPSEIRIVERLPRTERGKLDRAALLREAR